MSTRTAPEWRPVAHIVFLVAAIVLFVIYALVGTGTISSGTIARHPAAFLGFGLAALAAAFV
jgi:hypothetical protein